MMSTSLRALFIAGAFLPALGSLSARAEVPNGIQPARYVCNADGRCYETGDLDRRDDDGRPRHDDEGPRRDDRRPPPPYVDRDPRGPDRQEFDRRDFDRRDFDRPDFDRRDFDRRPPPPLRDFDRRPPPPRDDDRRRDPRDDEAD